MDILLVELEKDIWIRLLNGAIKPKNPLQYFTISSISSLGPRLRTVVLRKTSITNKQIWVYTDIRSQKWKDYSENPLATALFYDGLSKIQIRLEGEVKLIQKGKLWEDCWNATSLKSRKSYMTEMGPGTPIDKKWTGLDPQWEESEPNLEGTNRFKNNFGIILFQVKTMEYLQLERNGNFRAQFDYLNDSLISASWLVP